jgi:hypothetical protein
MGGDTNKGLLLPYFNGEPDKFKGWWMRFKAFATIKSFGPAIQRTKEAELPADESTNVSSDKPKQAAKNRNLMAIACLTAAFQDDGLLNLIEGSMTQQWPSGLAYLVVDALYKRYRPVDIIMRVEMRTRLNQVSMKTHEDPRTLFDQLASIQSAYNDAKRRIDPDDLIAVVLEKAPDEYKSILTAEQRVKGTNLTLEDLRSCMNDLYRTRSSKSTTDPNQIEVSLAAHQMKFNGVCGYCEKTGHSEEKCWHKNANRNKNKTLRPCIHCGGKHMDFKCWELPSNANKRPKNWKSKIGEEAANIAHDGRASTDVELLLSNMDEHLNYGQNDESLLMDPNIWIGDSAASVHMSPHEEGMTNKKKIRGEITVGNGEVIVTKLSGDIPCEVQDKHGKSVTKALISDVVLTKGTPYNLFSLTKMMSQGWILRGKNNTGITLKKGDNVLSFDIPIKTPRGIVYAMKMRRNKGKDPSASGLVNNAKAVAEGTERDIPNTNPIAMMWPEEEEDYGNIDEDVDDNDDQDVDTDVDDNDDQEVVTNDEDSDDHVVDTDDDDGKKDIDDDVDDVDADNDDDDRNIDDENDIEDDDEYDIDDDDEYDIDNNDADEDDDGNVDEVDDEDGEENKNGNGEDITEGGNAIKDNMQSGVTRTGTKFREVKIKDKTAKDVNVPGACVNLRKSEAGKKRISDVEKRRCNNERRPARSTPDSTFVATNKSRRIPLTQSGNPYCTTLLLMEKMTMINIEVGRSVGVHFNIAYALTMTNQIIHSDTT